MIFAFHQRPKFKWLVLIEKAAEEDSSIPLFFFVQYSIALLKPISLHVSRHFICHLTWHLLRFFFSIRLFSFVLSLSFSSSTSSSLLFFSSAIECSRAKNSYKCEHMNKFNKRKKMHYFNHYQSCVIDSLCEVYKHTCIQMSIQSKTVSRLKDLKLKKDLLDVLIIEQKNICFYSHIDIYSSGIVERKDSPWHLSLAPTKHGFISNIQHVNHHSSLSFVFCSLLSMSSLLLLLLL